MLYSTPVQTKLDLEKRLILLSMDEKEKEYLQYNYLRKQIF